MSLTEYTLLWECCHTCSYGHCMLGSGEKMGNNATSNGCYHICDTLYRNWQSLQWGCGSTPGMPCAWPPKHKRSLPPVARHKQPHRYYLLAASPLVLSPAAACQATHKPTGRDHAVTCSCLPCIGSTTRITLEHGRTRGPVKVSKHILS